MEDSHWPCRSDGRFGPGPVGPLSRPEGCFITRLRRYQGCSDSCAWMRVWLAQPGTHPLLVCRAGLPTSRASPAGISVSNHHPASPNRFGICPVSVGGFPLITGLGFAISSGDRESAQPNRVRAITDSPFASRCSPHDLAMTQLRSADRTETGIRERDLHLSDVARLWTHDGRTKPGHDDGMVRIVGQSTLPPPGISPPPPDTSAPAAPAGSDTSKTA